MYLVMSEDYVHPDTFVNPNNNTGLFMGNYRYYNNSFEIDDTTNVPINLLSVDQFQTDINVNSGTVTGTVYLYGKEGN